MIFLSRMLAITRGHRGLLSIAVFGSVLYTALSILPALIIRQMLTALAHPSPAGTLVWLGLAMIGATALMAVSRYLEGGFGHIAAFKVLHDMRMRIYEQLQRLSMGYHTRQQSGTIAAKVIGDVETLEFFTAHAGIQLISAATVPLLIGIVMLLVNWQLALVALAPLVLILFLLVAFRRSAIQAFKRYRDELGRLNGIIIDYIQGVGVLKAFGALGHARRAIDERSDELKKASTQANLIHTWYFSGVEWMAAIPVALVLLVGGLMANAHQLSVANLVFFVFLTTLLYRPVTELNRQLEGLRNAEAATDRIFEILNTPVDVQDLPAGRHGARPGRAKRRGQDDGGEPDRSLLGSAGGLGAVRGRRYPRTPTGLCPSLDQPGATGRLSLQRHRQGQYQDWKPGCERRPGGGGGARGLRPRVRRRTAERLRHDHRRARREAVRWAETANLDRPSTAPRRAHPDPG
ncbi:MAG: ABC transporter ATP-binding protein [Chloroflexota bacterium]|nr:MAG: ABC transporter ATP-binding protein [Chloroflexota bacterium]